MNSDTVGLWLIVNHIEPVKNFAWQNMSYLSATYRRNGNLFYINFLKDWKAVWEQSLCFKSNRHWVLVETGAPNLRRNIFGWLFVIPFRVELPLVGEIGSVKSNSNWIVDAWLKSPTMTCRLSSSNEAKKGREKSKKIMK